MGVVIDDKQILVEIKRNHEVGLRLLFDRYYRPLCVYAMKFIDDIQVAEDLVQEIFIKIWEDKKYKDIKGSLKNYLFVSIRNRSINYLSSVKKVNTEYLEHVKKEFAFQTYDEEEIEEKRRKLMAEIDKLPPQSKKVLMKIVFERKKYKEVSEEMDISLNTVKTHFSRALKQLRSSVDVMLLFMM